MLMKRLKQLSMDAKIQVYYYLLVDLKYVMNATISL